MLILSRKAQEKIMIADDIEVKVVRISGHRVVLALTAPDSVHIVRGEISNAPRNQPGTTRGDRCRRHGCKGSIIGNGREGEGVYCPSCGWDSQRDELL